MLAALQSACNACQAPDCSTIRGLFLTISVPILTAVFYYFYLNLKSRSLVRIYYTVVDAVGYFYLKFRTAGSGLILNICVQ